MMKIFVILAALAAISAAKPQFLAPLVAGPSAVVTATSSQYYDRYSSGLAAYVASPAAYVASPGAYVAPAAPLVASPYVAAPYASAPLIAV